MGIDSHLREIIVKVIVRRNEGYTFPGFAWQDFGSRGLGSKGLRWRKDFGTKRRVWGQIGGLAVFCGPN